MSAQEFSKKMTKKGFTIAFAESMTGGALAYELVKYSGASNILKASIVAYSVEQKMNLLNLENKEKLEQHIVSQEVATMMAKAVQKKCSSTISVGVTGNAGPTLQKHTSKKEAFVSVIFYEEIKSLNIDLTDLTRIQSIKKVVKETYQMLNLLV